MWLRPFLITEVNEANVYIIACPRTREAALIDAAACTDEILDAICANGFRLGMILITHNHYDHTSGLADYAKAFPGVEVIAGKAAAGIAKMRVVSDGDALQLGDLAIRVIGLSGHTPDSLGYLFAGKDARAENPTVLFSGDALFAGSIGGTATDSDHRLEIDNIRSSVFTLPETTLICPGHGPATTVGIERAANPFFAEG